MKKDLRCPECGDWLTWWCNPHSNFFHDLGSFMLCFVLGHQGWTLHKNLVTDYDLERGYPYQRATDCLYQYQHSLNPDYNRRYMDMGCFCDSLPVSG